MFLDCSSSTKCWGPLERKWGGYQRNPWVYVAQPHSSGPSPIFRKKCIPYFSFTHVYTNQISIFLKKRIGLSYRTSVIDISLTDKVRLSKSPDHLNFHSHLLLILNTCSCSKTKYQHEGNSLKFQSLKPISFKSSGIIPIFFSVS